MYKLEEFQFGLIMYCYEDEFWKYDNIMHKKGRCLFDKHRVCELMRPKLGQDFDCLATYQSYESIKEQVHQEYRENYIKSLPHYV